MDEEAEEEERKEMRQNMVNGRKERGSETAGNEVKVDRNSGEKPQK